MSRSCLTHPHQDLRFSNENVRLLGGNFYGRIFTRRELSSRHEYYPGFPAGFSPGSWRRVFFLAGSRQVQISRRDSCGGNFSQAGSRRENGPPRRDPGRIPVSAGNLSGIPARSRYLFYKGRLQLCLLSEQLRTSVAVTKLTSIYWSLGVLRGSYTDILLCTRFSLRATCLNNSFAFKFPL